MKVSVRCHRRVTAAALLSVAGLMLVGCAGTVDRGAVRSDGSNAPEAHASVSTSPPQDVTVPELPAAALVHSEAAVEATVEFWWEALHYLRSTGDPEPLFRLYDADCELCLQQALAWSDLYEDGGWAAVSPPELSIDSTIYDQGRATAGVDIGVSESPIQIFDAEGQPIPALAVEGSHDEPWMVSLIFDDEASLWRVEEMRIAEG